MYILWSIFEYIILFNSHKIPRISILFLLHRKENRSARFNYLAKVVSAGAFWKWMWSPFNDFYCCSLTLISLRSALLKVNRSSTRPPGTEEHVPGCVHVHREQVLLSCVLWLQYSQKRQHKYSCAPCLCHSPSQCWDVWINVQLRACLIPAARRLVWPLPRSLEIQTRLDSYGWVSFLTSLRPRLSFFHKKKQRLKRPENSPSCLVEELGLEPVFPVGPSAIPVETVSPPQSQRLHWAVQWDLCRGSHGGLFKWVDRAAHLRPC